MDIRMKGGICDRFLVRAITALALLLIIGIRLVGRAESKTPQNISAKAGDTTQEQIARAMSADQITFLMPHESSIQMRRAIK